MKYSFTEKQGQYLAFIYNYTKINYRPPAESDIQKYFKVTPPTVHQMILKLEENELISRTPRKERTLRVLVPPGVLPYLK
jgi:repressor LexA